MNPGALLWPRMSARVRVKSVAERGSTGRRSEVLASSCAMECNAVKIVCDGMQCSKDECNRCRHSEARGAKRANVL
eukprot:3086415-Pleurochrysis_carterae.AAC.1